MLFPYMLRSLLRFEIRYHIQTWLFAVISLTYAGLGFAFGTLGFRVSDLAANSPYVIGNILSLLSIGGIFSASLFAANAMLRDKEALMESFIFTSSIHKSQLLVSRFSGMFATVVLSYSGILLGLGLAMFSAVLMGESILPFSLSTYLNPLLYIVLPNLLIISLLTFSVAAVSRNRILTYLGGLALYIFYVVGAMYMKAPWLASPSPPTPEQIVLAAKIDPFGLSAFYEQTRFWTAEDQNILNIKLEGHLLFNRGVWLGAALLLGGLAYRAFQFRLLHRRTNKHIVSETETEVHKTAKFIFPTSLIPSSRSQQLLALIKLESRLLWQSWPYRIFLFMWTFIMGIETLNAPKGGTRMGDREPWSGFMADNIMSVIPFFAVFGILVFSNLILWRERSQRIAPLLDSINTSNAQQAFVKCLAIIQIPLSMLSLSIVLAIGLQLLKGWTEVEIWPYAQLFYYLALPLGLTAILAIFIQSIFAKRFLGLAVSAIVILLCSSSLLRLLELDHLTILYLKPIRRAYSEMNGYGSFADQFHWRMAYGVCLSLFLGVLAILYWPRGIDQGILRQAKSTSISPKWIWGSATLLLLSMSSFIYLSEIKQSVPRRGETEAWQLRYESKYAHIQKKQSPHIEQVRTHIDLYPNEQAYRVKAQYELCNPHDIPLNQMWIALDQVAKLDSLSGKGISISKADQAFGMYLVALNPPMKPGESRTIHFQFYSGWSPFGGLTPFNAIVKNGSFIRISRYFPLLGYQTDWEMSGTSKRKKHGLAPNENFLTLEAPTLDYPYQDFIHWEAIISTEADQRIVAPGQQIAHWQEGERSYFHFRTQRPIPFRFAVSSARYAERLDSVAGIRYRILHHPAHKSQIEQILAASQQTIAYCERAFGPYPFGELQIAEMSDFTEGFAATAYPNTIYIRESMGWYDDLNDLDGPNRVFLMMAHEIAHQWWGGQLKPEYREGGIFLTESLAQYTAYMLHKEAFGEAATQKALLVESELYFQDRGFEESSLLRARQDQPYVAYQKGAVVLYAIQTLIGEKQFNHALTSMLKKHAYPQMPATSLDMLNAILDNSPTKHHSQISQWLTEVEVADEDERLIVRIPD